MHTKLFRTIENVISAVAEDHGLVDVRDAISRESRLGDDLGMDEVDIIAVLSRAEEAFGVVLPDHEIDSSSTVADVVALVADRLDEKQASLTTRISPAHVSHVDAAQVQTV